MHEEFKTIVDFDNYAVSNCGNIKNIKTNKILKPTNDGRGYYKINLHKNGISTTKKLHRLIAESFIDNPDNKPFIDHIDSNKLNNNIDNLRWATNQENQRNSKLSSKNTSGAKGVHFSKRDKKWYATITIDCIKIHLGCYNTIEEAKNARITKANEVFGIYTNKCEK
jgi:hypothetical protein